MENLILDVKISIAEKDREVWWLFYLYFDDFKNYTRRYTPHYCRLFTKIIYSKLCTKYYYLNTTYIRHNDGDQYWYQNGILHRHGGPAVIDDGDQYWYQDGKQHRDGGPAVIYSNGAQYWYQHGEPHRDGGPAIIYASGIQHWYQHGRRIK